MEANPQHNVKKLLKNTFLALFPPGITILCYVVFDARISIYLGTLCLTLITAFRLRQVKNFKSEIKVLRNHWQIKMVIGIIIIITKFFLTTLLIMNNNCLNCIEIGFFDVNNELIALDILVISLLKPLMIDLYYNFFLFERLKIGRYNKYFTFITRLFYSAIDYLAIFELKNNLNIFIIETFWLFYLSYIGKYHVLNSTFLRMCGDFSNVLVVILISLNYLGVNNNFWFHLG